MTVRTSLFPKARIPYGTWGTSYFPAWQMSPLAEVNIGQFAAESMNRILGIRKVPKDRLDYLITGSTIPWHWKFWNSPMLSSILGQRLPGFHVEQACATGLQAVVHAAAEVESGSKEFVGVDLRPNERLPGRRISRAPRPPKNLCHQRRVGQLRFRSGYRKLDARSRRKRGPEIPS